MTAKIFFRLTMSAALLVAALVLPGAAAAGGYCASYVTVQWGDTLSGIAAACGTTVEAIQAANPGLGWWLYAGQVLYIPGGASAPAVSTGGSYVVQWGDTLGNIAAQYSVSLSDLLAANPQIWNINLIYPGQVINIPAYASPYPPSPVYPPGQNPYGKLTITYNYGMIVRTGPGKNYPAIDSIYVSAVKDSVWEYRKNSTTIDPMGYVWVEVKLHPWAPYSVGWILARDTLGKYYSEPKIDP